MTSPTKEQAHTAAIQSEIERFEDQYIPEPNSGCWIWIGSLFSSKVAKYARGKVRIAGKEQVASRFSFQLFKGEIPTGLFVCHRCDMPSVRYSPVRQSGSSVAWHSCRQHGGYDRQKSLSPQG